MKHKYLKGEKSRTNQTRHLATLRERVTPRHIYRKKWRKKRASHKSFTVKKAPDAADIASSDFLKVNNLRLAQVKSRHETQIFKAFLKKSFKKKVDMKHKYSSTTYLMKHLATLCFKRVILTIS